MEWMLMPLRRYADFSGRSRRKEYWMFTLFILPCLYLVLGDNLQAHPDAESSQPLTAAEAR